MEVTEHGKKEEEVSETVTVVHIAPSMHLQGM